METTDEARVAHLSALVEQILEGMPLELVEVTVQGANRPRICVFLDGPDGVSVDHCAQVSRSLSEILDEEELLDEGTRMFSGAYRLEVSSPGLDRIFETPDDFRRNLTRRVQVQYLEAKPGGVETFIGTLESLNEDSFEVLLDDGKTVHCQFEEVRKVHRSIEL